MTCLTHCFIFKICFATPITILNSFILPFKFFFCLLLSLLFHQSHSSPASMCSPTDPPAVCQLKKGQCSPVGAVFSPPGGPVKAVTSCANTTGVALGPQFFMSIG